MIIQFLCELSAVLGLVSLLGGIGMVVFPHDWEESKDGLPFIFLGVFLLYVGSLGL